MVGTEFNAPLDTISVISEAVFTANHLTDTDIQNSTGKYGQTNSIQIRKSKQPKIQLNKTTLVQVPNTRPGNEVGLFYNAPEPTRHRIVPDCVTLSTVKSKLKTLIVSHTLTYN